MPPLTPFSELSPRYTPLARLKIGAGTTLCALLAILFQFPASAELPAIRLHSIFPAGGQAGASIEVAVSGADLDDVSSLHFSHPGITAQPKLHELTGHRLKERFAVKINSDVTPGAYEVRAIGRFGVSNPRRFAVGQFDEWTETQANDSIATATTLPLERTVNGRTEANRIEHFKFKATKGQRLLIHCLAHEIDSRLSPVLVLLTPDGRELERNRRGGLLDFTVAADGEFILKLHDSVYRGGPDFFYRMSISTAPYIDFVFPPAGLPGTQSRFTLYGRNLGGSPTEFSIDGKLLEETIVEIRLPALPERGELLATHLTFSPAAAALQGFEYRFARTNSAGARVTSNPVLIGFAEAPVVLESNDPSAPIQKLAPPAELCGRFYPAGDRDFAAFTAQKGDVYWLEVISNRLGLPTDPFLLVQRISKSDDGSEQVADIQELYDTDSNIGGPEFNTASRDLSWRFEAKETGEYRVQIRDLFNPSRSHAGFVYRLVLRKENPDFQLVATPQAPPPNPRDKKEALIWTPLLRRSGTIPIKVLAFRRDNFNGEIELTVEGLPSGVRFHPAKIEAGKTSTILFLSADEDAQTWAGPVQILGKAKVGDTERLRQARAASVLWNVPDYNNEPISSRLTPDLFLGVSGAEFSPIVVTTADLTTYEAAANSKLSIPIKILRPNPDFNELTKLKPAGIAQLDGAQEVDVQPKDTNTTLEVDLGQLKVPAGTHAFFVVGASKGKYRRLAGEALKAAEAAAKAAEEKAKQAEAKAAELAATRKTAAENLAKAVALAEEIQSKARQISERLVALNSASANTEEVSTAKVAAEKELAELEAKAKSALESKTSAERKVQDAEAKLKQAEQAKAAAAEFAKETKENLKNAEPKEVPITVYSPPILVKVK